MITTLLAVALGLSARAQLLSTYSQDETAYGARAQSTKPNQSNTCSDPNWDSDCVCGQQKQKIEWVKKHGQPLNTFNWSRLRSKQLVMIGDEHGLSNPSSLLDLINLARSDSGKQCIFFEFSSDSSKGDFLNLLKVKTGYPETDDLRSYYGKIVNGAISQGFELYTVDDPRNWTGDGNISDFDREAHMAATIKKLFDSHKCDHAIQVVGKAHVGGSNLSDALTRSQISLVKLNPVWAPAGDRSGSTEEWNGLCKTQLYTPNEAVIFENSGIKDDSVVPSFFVSQNSMKYGNFDYSILFPESHFDQKTTAQTSRPTDGARVGVQ